MECTPHDPDFCLVGGAAERGGNRSWLSCESRLFFRGEREVGTKQCVHVFLSAERCLPIGVASRFELFGSQVFYAHSVVVSSFSEEG